MTIGSRACSPWVWLEVCRSQSATDGLGRPELGMGALLSWLPGLFGLRPGSRGAPRPVVVALAEAGTSGRPLQSLRYRCRQVQGSARHRLRGRPFRVPGYWGTSLAAPLVVGDLALMKQFFGDQPSKNLLPDSFGPPTRVVARPPPRVRG